MAGRRGHHHGRRHRANLALPVVAGVFVLLTALVGGLAWALAHDWRIDERLTVARRPAAVAPEPASPAADSPAAPAPRPRPAPRTPPPDLPVDTYRLDYPLLEAAQASTDAYFAPTLWLTPSGRSPMPLPGETLERPLPARWLATPQGGELAPPVAAGTVVPWHEAHRHLGREVVVEGQVVLARNTGSVCFLNFSRDWQGKFYIILFKETLDAFPEPPERYFLNRTIQVRGQVTTHRNVPQIQVRNPAQISIVERSGLFTP